MLNGRFDPEPTETNPGAYPYKDDGNFDWTGEGQGAGRNVNIPFCGAEVIAKLF